MDAFNFKKFLKKLNDIEIENILNEFDIANVKFTVEYNYSISEISTMFNFNEKMFINLMESPDELSYKKYFKTLLLGNTKFASSVINLIDTYRKMKKEDFIEELFS